MDHIVISYNQYKELLESSIDHIRKTLSKYVFELDGSDYPLIKKDVKEYLLNRIENIELTYGYEIKQVFVIGSILTKQYRNDADVDINLFFDVPLEEQELFLETIYKNLIEINGQKLLDTEHIVNFYIMVDQDIQDNNLDKAESIYDLLNDNWLKKGNLEGFNYKNVYNNFSNNLNVYLKELDLLHGELNRDIIDYQTLDKLSKDDIDNIDSLIQDKLDEIENNILDYHQKINKITDDRRALFNREMTLDEIKIYVKHNNLPTNLIYKLLEKYHYIKFAKKIDKVLGDNIITKKELYSLKKT